MLRVVIEPSVLIRYLIKPSASIRYLIEEMWFNEDVVLVTSPELLADLDFVLRRRSIRKFIHVDEGKALLEAILVKAEKLPLLNEIPVFTRDLKDDKFVACAIAGRASYVITEDRDILALGSVGDVQMITPYEFVERHRQN